MEREEAAMLSLDNLPGFRGDFFEYRQAADTLTGDDKAVLHHAASGRLRRDEDVTKR